MRFAYPGYADWPRTNLVRASLRYVNAKDSKAVVAALNSRRGRGSAGRAGCARSRLGCKYRAVVRLWRGNWDNVIPFFQFVPEIRKVDTGGFSAPNA